jgi:hypothetical protein
MPPRWLTLFILAFWAATTGWMVYREVLPRLRANDPPPFAIELTDEVNGPAIIWVVLENGKDIGSGASMVRRMPDRTFRLYSEFAFKDVNLIPTLKFRKLTSMYRVTAEGALREFEATAQSPIGIGQDISIHVSGEVEDGFLSPQIEVSGFPKVKGAKVQVPVNVLNPMHLLNKLRGVHEGQSWVIPLLDPVSANLPGQPAPEMPLVEGTVVADVLTWHAEEVPCFKIEYRPVGANRIVARTWVRQHDGLVLQQEAHHQGMQLVLQRFPPR